MIAHGTWKYNEDADEFNVNGKVDMSPASSVSRDYDKLPLKFGIVTEAFSCSKSSLKTLEGCPREVGLFFTCFGCNGLTTLEGAPKKVGRTFNASSCKNLQTIQGCPWDVGQIISIKDCPNLFPLEKNLLEDSDLTKEWLKEGGKNLREFLNRKRGFLKGKKFNL